MNNNPSPYLEQMRQVFHRELAHIKGLKDPVEQALSYEALIYNVLAWQGLSIETKDHIFRFAWNGDPITLLFWPIHSESVQQPLSQEIIRARLPSKQPGCVLVASLVGFAEEMDKASQDENILLLDGTDIDALCGIEWSFAEMLRFKQREMELYGQPGVNYLAYLAKQRKDEKPTALLTPIAEWLGKGTDLDAMMFREDARARWVDFERGLIVDWPQYAALSHFLEDKPGERKALIVSGTAGSGKSTFLYTVGFRCLLSGIPVYYYNTAELQLSNIEILVDEVASLPNGSVVLIDDLHQRAVLVNKVIGGIVSERPDIKIVAATRPPYFAEVREALHGTYGWRPFAIERIDLQPTVIIDQLIAQFAREKNTHLSGGVIQELKLEVGQDITLLGWMLRHMETGQGIRLTYDEAVLKYRLTPLQTVLSGLWVEALALLYVVAFFEQFDVRVRGDFLESLGFDASLVERLITLGYIVKQNDALGIGHANLARLYIKTLDKRTELGWMAFLQERLKLGHEDDQPSSAIRIALLDKYFAQRKVDARSRAILNICLYFVPEAKPTPLHQEMSSMTGAIERAIELLVLYFQRDPTGEHSVSNSAFMAQVFAKLGRMDLAEQAVDFAMAQQEVRSDGSAWFILDPLRVTSVKDWEKVKELLALEDKNPDPLTIQVLERVHGTLEGLNGIVERVDFNRAHQTWLSAHLLPSIMMARGRDHPRFEQTLKTVLINQDQERGWFYAPEFCWLTARCVINLALVGVPIDSPAIVKGRDWLLHLQFDDGRWHTPDWRWNPSEEMTAMSVYALTLAGVPHEHPSIQKAKDWLLSRQKDGRWNDNAHYTGHVVEALNAIDFPIDELRLPLRFMERSVSRDDWYQTIIGAKARQSLEIGELANMLLDVETKYLFDYVRSALY
jgi:hypothetical protein